MGFPQLGLSRFCPARPPRPHRARIAPQLHGEARSRRHQGVVLVGGEPLKRSLQPNDELLTNLGGGELLAHEVLDQGVEAHLESLAEHRVSAFRRANAGVTMPVVQFRRKDRLVDFLLISRRFLSSGTCPPGSNSPLVISNRW